MNNEVLQKSFWSLQKFLIANVVVAALLLLGLRITGTQLLTGFIAGFYISAPFLWFLGVSIVWWIVLASFLVHLFRKGKLCEQYPLGVIVGAWVVTLIPAWFLFLAMLRLYVVVNAPV